MSYTLTQIIAQVHHPVLRYDKTLPNYLSTSPISYYIRWACVFLYLICIPSALAIHTKKRKKKDVYFYIHALQNHQSTKADRRKAVKNLTDLAHPDSIDCLVYVAKDDKDTFVKRHATRALSKIQDPRTVDTLIEIMKNEKDQSVRMEATKSLGMIIDKRVVQPLICRVKEEQNSIVRRYAVTSLTKQGDKRGIAVLAYAAKYDKSEIVRRYANRGLKTLADSSDVKAILKSITRNKNTDHLQKELVISLKNKGKKQRKKPRTMSLSYSKWNIFWKYELMDKDNPDTSSVGFWIDALQNSKSTYVQKKSALALRSIKMPISLSVLMDTFATSSDQGVRRSTIRAIKSLKDAKALELFINSLKEDKDATIRIYAAKGLKYLYEFLKQLEDQYDQWISKPENYDIEKKEMYVRMLQQYEKKAIEALIYALESDRDNQVKISCITTLRALKAKQAKFVLIDCIKNSKNTRLRYEALRAIQTISPSRDIHAKRSIISRSNKHRNNHASMINKDNSSSDSDGDNDGTKEVRRDIQFKIAAAVIVGAVVAVGSVI